MQNAGRLVACLGFAAVLSTLPLYAGSGTPATRADAEARAHRAVEPETRDEAPAFVLRGGTVMTAAGARHEPGYVIVRDGSIVSVGAGEPPADEIAGATVIDVTGQFVTPGLIDAHSHLGVYPAPDFQAHSDGNEMSSPVTAGAWAEHALWPQDPGIELAVRGGVTTMLVLPGSGNLIGGRGVTVHLVPARGSRMMRFPGAPDVLKMACGENPKRVYGGKGTAPQTRMGNVRGQREAFFAAERYRLEWDRWYEKNPEAKEPAAAAADRSETRKKKKKENEGPGELPPARDAGLDTLVEVLEGRVLVEWHCYRADDMLGAIQLAAEAGFRIRTFHHALEAYKIRDVLAAEGIAVATWTDWWGFKIEAFDGIEQNAALLAEAGVRAVIKSDSPIDIQRLNQEAGKALAAARAAGLPLTEDQALALVTANPAWALGIESEVGSIETGKRADLVVWDAHPFSVYARAHWVFIDGRLRFDRERPGDPWSDYMLGQEAAR